MSVRITGGRLRGRTIAVPAGQDLRPTAAIVREALFSMIGQHLDGWRVVDLFGGSGLMAIEAASRGADPVIVVERDPRVARELRRSADSLGLNLDVRPLDARRFTATAGEPIDLVFMDPPYKDDPEGWLKVGAALAPRWLVLEHRTGARLPAAVGGLVQDRLKTYGGSSLIIYRPRPQPRLEEAERVAQDEGVVEDDGQAARSDPALRHQA